MAESNNRSLLFILFIVFVICFFSAGAQQVVNSLPNDKVRVLPNVPVIMQFPAKIIRAVRLDVGLATYDKFKEAITAALGPQLADSVYQSLLHKDYPKGFDDPSFLTKNEDAIIGFNGKSQAYACTRICMLNRGFDALIKVEAAANQQVKKPVRPKKDFYFFAESSNLEVERNYRYANIAFGTRARILGTGIIAALANPFNSEGQKSDLFQFINFLDTASLQRVIERSKPSAMPAAISSSYNYQYTKYQGKIYNGYIVGTIWGRVLMCIPAKENYHITSLCLRPYDDIYLMLESADVEVDDGSGSIAMLSDVYPFNCSQLEPRPQPVSKNTGRPMRTVTRVLKNQHTSCSVCLGAGKVYYQDGYKRDYVNSTYQKVSASYSVKRCNYCSGTGFLRSPDVTIEVYEND